MKKLIYFLMTVLMVVGAISCKKDNSGSNDNDGKVPVPEAVDIGLVVNGKTIKWASFNLGASKEYEYGNHYAWGETEPKSNYDWTTYLLANGNEEKLIAYCPRNKADYWDSDVKPNGPDGEDKLLPSHDAAHAKLGGGWRMPTLEEFEALLALKEDTDNYDCNFWALVIDENGNEIRDANGDVVHGFRITQKSTGNSIFFPAAGYYLQERLLKTAAEGSYWSSTLDTDNPSYAFYVCFQPADAYSVSYPRLYGRSIRPVWDENNENDDPNAFETDMGHTGEMVVVPNNRVGDIPDGKPWKYEQWSESGQGGTLTVWGNGTFKAAWTSVNNYIVRVGYKYGGEGVSYKSKNHVADYNYVKTGGASGNSFIGAYGWTVNPLTEWYIVDDWYNDLSDLGQSKGTYSLDGDTYTVLTQTRTGVTILGKNEPFTQIFCVRAHRRQKGRLSLSSHFEEIRKMGVNFGDLYEVSLGIDVYSSSGGSIEYNHFNLKE